MALKYTGSKDEIILGRDLTIWNFLLSKVVEIELKTNSIHKFLKNVLRLTAKQDAL